MQLIFLLLHRQVYLLLPKSGLTLTSFFVPCEQKKTGFPCYTDAKRIRLVFLSLDFGNPAILIFLRTRGFPSSDYSEFGFVGRYGWPQAFLIPARVIPYFHTSSATNGWNFRSNFGASLNFIARLNNP
jgi:hypothetical protein